MTWQDANEGLARVCARDVDDIGFITFRNQTNYLLILTDKSRWIIRDLLDINGTVKLSR